MYINKKKEGKIKENKNLLRVLLRGTLRERANKNKPCFACSFGAPTALRSEQPPVMFIIYLFLIYFFSFIY